MTRIDIWGAALVVGAPDSRAAGKETPVRDPRIRTMVAIAAVTAMLVVPTTVWAIDRFTDVPDTNVFHDDISWLADNGVTLGCNPPANTEFCPSDNVTREQMAAFMRRLAVNGVVDAATLAGEEPAWYRSVVVSASCGVSISGMTVNTSCLPTAGGSAPDAVAIEMLSIEIEAPADGGIQLDMTGLEADTLAHWFSLNETCVPYDPLDLGPLFDQAVNGHIWGSETGASTAAAGLTFAAPAGTHVVRLCGVNNTGAPVDVLSLSLTGEWNRSTTVDLATAGGSAPAGSHPLLDG